MRSLAGTSGACAGRLGETERLGVDAEAVFGRVADEGLGIDGPTKVHVEVGAFGKLLEKGVQREGTCLDGGLVGDGLRVFR